MDHDDFRPSVKTSIQLAVLTVTLLLVISAAATYTATPSKGETDSCLEFTKPVSLRNFGRC
jgi:hypothetical protein